MKTPFSRRVSAGLMMVCAGWSCAHARVTSVEVRSREPVLNGAPFGAAGPYERIVGRVHFRLDAGDAPNRRVVDLDKAVTTTRGIVEFTSDVVILQPTDPVRRNGTLLLEIPNRGRSGMVRMFDGGDGAVDKDAGDGWFLRQGYSFASLGWQWDAVGADAIRLTAPIARDHGRTITGLLRGDVMPSAPQPEIELGHVNVGELGGAEYPAAAPDDPRNTLSVRDSPMAPRRIIPRAQWSFAHASDGRVASSPRHIRLEGGFQPGRLYEYVYVVADPVVAGLGFAAVRDFASYVKGHADASLAAHRVIGVGISQSGRFLRDFLYQGFNADESGRRALDGVLAHVAGAGRGSFNQRFAQPSRDAQPTSSITFPTDVFPFTDLPEIDPVTQRRDGLLQRATRMHVTPKIFLSNTSYEYWGRAASLVTTTADGGRDVVLSPDVRVYHFTGLQHFSGPWPPAPGRGALSGQQPQSPLPVRFFWRAMLTNMDEWLRHDTAPPPSRYPRLDDGTLVGSASYAFPPLPGMPTPPSPSPAWHLDFATQPPRVGSPYPVLVPQVDADGNELGGVRLPEFSAPLASYVPWNLRNPAIGAADQRVSFEGSYLPFARTAADRANANDPRAAVEERYRTRGDYLDRYTAALDGLIAARFVLPDDRAALLRLAGEEWDLAVR